MDSFQMELAIGSTEINTNRWICEERHFWVCLGRKENVKRKCAQTPAWPVDPKLVGMSYTPKSLKDLDTKGKRNSKGWRFESHPSKPTVGPNGQTVPWAQEGSPARSTRMFLFWRMPQDQKAITRRRPPMWFPPTWKMSTPGPFGLRVEPCVAVVPSVVTWVMPEKNEGWFCIFFFCPSLPKLPVDCETITVHARSN